MKYVFGPVPSRRLGQSLGIDTIPPKTCNWNCVYCQLGRSVPLVHERREYYPRQDILLEVEQALADHRPGEIDWVTFVGSGEPTLHSGLGWLIRQVKELSDLPVAVITNGAFLYLPEVRLELSLADAVLPSLDAGNARLYRKINRPWPELTFERLLQGLQAFRQEYHGKFWVEVMLVKGLNDSEACLTEIARRLERIQPDQVHINLPTRPPAEAWVQLPDQDGLLRAMGILGDVAEVVHPAEGEFDLSGDENVVEAILNIITRHPMSQEQLVRALGRWQPEAVDQALGELEASRRVQVVRRYGSLFWTVRTARFPEENLKPITNDEQRSRRL